MHTQTKSMNNMCNLDAMAFKVAGCFMLINTLFLWVRFYLNYELSILWAAIPAIIGLASSVIGLLKLYPKISGDSPLLAKIGAGFAITACVALSLAAMWIFISSVFGDGPPEQSSRWFLILIAVFMLAMVSAFFSNAIAFLRHSKQRKIGYLLTVPLAMWSLMLVVGVIKGMEVGLSLDFYTNAVIGVAFLALGHIFKTKVDSV